MMIDGLSQFDFGKLKLMWLYAVQSEVGNEHRIKVGVSHNISQRMRSYQVNTLWPSKLLFLSLLPTDMAQEIEKNMKRMLHRENYNVYRTEVFSVPEIIFMKKICFEFSQYGIMPLTLCDFFLKLQDSRELRRYAENCGIDLDFWDTVERFDFPTPINWYMVLYPKYKIFGETKERLCFIRGEKRSVWILFPEGLHYSSSKSDNRDNFYRAMSDFCDNSEINYDEKFVP